LNVHKTKNESPLRPADGSPTHKLNHRKVTAGSHVPERSLDLQWLKIAHPSKADSEWQALVYRHNDCAGKKVLPLVLAAVYIPALAAFFIFLASFFSLTDLTGFFFASFFPLSIDLLIGYSSIL
jgi:hypothetical protein